MFGDMHFTLGESTNTQEVLVFMKSMVNKLTIPSNAVIVLDNHVCHKVQDLRDFMESKKVQLLFLPPNASFLNPVERMWGYYKKTFAKMLVEMNGDVHPDALGTIVIAALEKVKGFGTQLAKGPFKGMNHVYELDEERQVKNNVQYPLARS